MAKIRFVWQGVTERKDHWKDGLYAAMKLLEVDNEVTYCEPWDDLNADVVIYWEAPCTRYGPNSHHYERVRTHIGKKILLFAGGPLKAQDVDGFDIVVVESEINVRECNDLGITCAKAFGVNTDIFKPMNTKKYYETVTHGTSASWKRQWLVCQAMKEKALVFGQPQPNDTRPFDECGKCNSMVLHEQSYEETARLINHGKVAVNCADFWGGGQRATLEAMACGLPVVVMSDSPKNREYVEASGVGAICEPTADAIREAVKNVTIDPNAATEYVARNWSHQQYAKNLKDIIAQV